jgi:hypothetical protein
MPVVNTKHEYSQSIRQCELASNALLLVRNRIDHLQVRATCQIELVPQIGPIGFHYQNRDADFAIRINFEIILNTRLNIVMLRTYCSGATSG